MAAFTKVFEQHKNTIAKVSTSTEQVRVASKYGKITSVEKILEQNTERLRALEVAAERAHQANEAKMIDRELKLREKEERLEEKARQKTFRIAESQRKKKEQLRKREAALATREEEKRMRIESAQKKKASSKKRSITLYPEPLCYVPACMAVRSAADGWEVCMACGFSHVKSTWLTSTPKALDLTISTDAPPVKRRGDKIWPKALTGGNRSFRVIES